MTPQCRTAAGLSHYQHMAASHTFDARTRDQANVSQAYCTVNGAGGPVGDEHDVHVAVDGTHAAQTGRFSCGHGAKIMAKIRPVAPGTHGQTLNY